MIKAYKLFKMAEEHALDMTEGRYPRFIKDKRVGAHIQNNNENTLRTYLGYHCPIRTQDLTVSIPHLDIEFTQIGNELENDINGTPMTADRWKQLVVDEANKQGKPIPSPSLMTLKQFEWEELLEVETHISTWCLNYHIPGYLRRRLSHWGDTWEVLKHIDELEKFKRMTVSPIIFTEFGVGQTHLLTLADLKFLYIILNEIFGERMIACLAYDSDLALRNLALQAFRH